MKRIFLLLIACCFLSTLLAQSTRKIRELEAKRKELHQQIAESETLLHSTKKNVKSQLDNLALLTGQIEERRKYTTANQKAYTECDVPHRNQWSSKPGLS